MLVVEMLRSYVDEIVVVNVGAIGAVIALSMVEVEAHEVVVVLLDLIPWSAVEVVDVVFWLLFFSFEAHQVVR